ncbi:MAG: riboflavin synthase [Bacteroidetes bacterium]|nr:riboflavin synthase [Bacteroidota bacterium]
MFTGIVECMGVVEEMYQLEDIWNYWIRSEISEQCKIDQSICHDGICLTVVGLKPGMHRVQVIHETTIKTNILNWETGTKVNLERSMPANGRFDGHIVQGHVDGTGVISGLDNSDGQLWIEIQYQHRLGITVQKGSVCINGVSLTVAESKDGAFAVALIPYTRDHTNLGSVLAGDLVNIEFDIIGKYLEKLNRNKEN